MAGFMSILLKAQAFWLPKPFSVIREALPITLFLKNFRLFILFIE
jgi:hypothetical protein